jgi:DNA-binding MarR family transcriptional regulator
MNSLASLSPAAGFDVSDNFARADRRSPSSRSVHRFAKGLLRVRHSRADILACDMFRDPAWDMLLDLYVHSDQPRALSVSGLCAGAGVPATTALRHLKWMESDGLVTRWADRTDARRSYVGLADGLEDKIERVLGLMQDCA